MTRHSLTKRNYVRRPGLIEAARDLGVSYSHLRQCVAGVRKSRQMFFKLRAWKRQHRAIKTGRLLSPAAADVAAAAHHISNNPSKS